MCLCVRKEFWFWEQQQQQRHTLWICCITQASKHRPNCCISGTCFTFVVMYVFLHHLTHHTVQMLFPFYFIKGINTENETWWIMHESHSSTSYDAPKPFCSWCLAFLEMRKIFTPLCHDTITWSNVFYKTHTMDKHKAEPNGEVEE